MWWCHVVVPCGGAMWWWAGSAQGGWVGVGQRRGGRKCGAVRCGAVRCGAARCAGGVARAAAGPHHRPPISPLYIPYISPTSPLHLPYISRTTGRVDQLVGQAVEARAHLLPLLARRGGGPGGQHVRREGAQAREL